MGKKSAFRCPDCNRKYDRKVASEVTNCRKCGKFICIDCAYENDGVCRTCQKKEK
jgi:ribosomal protein L37AE/L43A